LFEEPWEATPPTSAPPRARVFISYSRDSEAHREQVRDLWIFLRANGIDARIERVAAGQRRDRTLWMEQQVTEADYILIVASPESASGQATRPTRMRDAGFSTRLG
jgi:hypothetical protein